MHFHLTNLTSALMKQACCLEQRSWSDFSSYSYVYMYWSGPYWFLQPTWTPAETYEFWCIGTLVNVYWIPWEELYNSWLGALPRKQKLAVEVKVQQSCNAELQPIPIMNI